MVRTCWSVGATTEALPICTRDRSRCQPHMTDINLAIAGATGWTGRAIVEGALAAPDITLKSALARSTAGQDLGTALGRDPLGVPVHADVDAALDGVDVLVEFTSHTFAKSLALAAVERGVAVVIGSSGLSSADFDEIDAAARSAGVGAVAAGNFSVTAAAALAAAELAARLLPRWEIIDYAKSTKPDAPSGTARELAERLGGVRPPEVDLPVSEVAGYPEARGATIAGTQVHSVRIPSFVVSTEVVFGAAGRAAQHPARRRRDRGAVRQRRAARGPSRPLAHGPDPRARPPAARRGVARAVAGRPADAGWPAGHRTRVAGRALRGRTTRVRRGTNPGGGGCWWCARSARRAEPARPSRGARQPRPSAGAAPWRVPRRVPAAKRLGASGGGGSSAAESQQRSLPRRGRPAWRSAPWGRPARRTRPSRPRRGS